MYLHVDIQHMHIVYWVSKYVNCCGFQGWIYIYVRIQCMCPCRISRYIGRRSLL